MRRTGAERPDLLRAFKIALGFKGGLGAGSRRGDRLLVIRIGAVSGGEYARTRGVRVLDADIAVFVEFERTFQECRFRGVSDGDECAGDFQPAGVGKRYRVELLNIISMATTSKSRPPRNIGIKLKAKNK